MARLARPGEETPFVNFLRERFAGRRLDLVVTGGSAALEFLTRHREKLFPEVPILFAGISERVVNSGRLPDNAAAIPLQIDLKGMVADILELLPGTENIAVIHGASPIEAFWDEAFRREAAAFSDRVRFIYLNHLSFDDIKRRVAALPPNSAVYIGLFLADIAQTPFDPGQALKEIVAEANAPVFAVIESYFGLGIVGGRLMQERAAGLQAAEAALRILAGHPAADLSRPALPPSAPVYDWRALERWGIREDRLPEGSRVYFRQPSLWELYHWHIAGGVGLLVLQAFLIARLLLQRRRQHRAEKALQQSEQGLRLITDSLPALISYVDSDQRYRFNNAAYQKWFGISPQEASGRTIREVVGEAYYRGVLPYLERALAGETVRFAQDFDRDDGRLASVEGIYVPDPDEWNSTAPRCRFRANGFNCTRWR